MPIFSASSSRDSPFFFTGLYIDPDGRRNFKYINHWSDDFRLRSEDLQESGSDDKGDEKNEPKDYFKIYFDPETGEISRIVRVDDTGGEKYDVVQLIAGETELENGSIVLDGAVIVNEFFPLSKRESVEGLGVLPGKWVKVELGPIKLSESIVLEPKVIGGGGILEWVSGGGLLKAGSLLLKVSKAAEGVTKALPSLDATGKVHGILPKVADFGKYSKDELRILLGELKQSVQKRIKVTSKMGRDRAHGQRQGAEQDLIKSLEKYLGN